MTHNLFDAEAVTRSWGEILFSGVGGRWTKEWSYSGDLVVTPGPHRIYNDEGRSLSIGTVRASVGTAPVGASVIIDIKKNGTTIYSTTGNRPTIAAGAHTVVATLPDDIVIASGDYLTADIVQIGSSTAGANLTVQVGAA